MRKTVVLLTLGGLSLISCGGGGGQITDYLQPLSVSQSVLMSCISLPTSLGDNLLGCLADKVSIGKDASGNECKVSFSSDRFNISSKAFSGNVIYQHSPNSGTKETTYLYDKSYSSNSGDLNFTVAASNAGIPYFNFGFVGNTKTGGGTVLFDFALTPDVPGVPVVTLQCQMQI